MRLIDAVAFWDNFNDELEMGVSDPGEAASNALDATPTVDAEPVKHGHWVNTGWRNSAYRADCSECGLPAYHYEYKGVQRYYSVCPHCGTKMDEEAGDEDTVSG